MLVLAMRGLQDFVPARVMDSVDKVDEVDVDDFYQKAILSIIENNTASDSQILL